MMSTAFSIASFSIVLAECFAMVGMSTLIPTGAVVAASVLRRAALTDPTGTTADTDKANDLMGKILSFGGGIASGPVNGIKEVLHAVATDMDSISLLVPKTAFIEADFKFHANETESFGAEGGGAIQMITVKAGFSSLFQVETSNSVHMRVDFGLVNFNLTSDKPGVIKSGTATKTIADVQGALVTSNMKISLKNLSTSDKLTFSIGSNSYDVEKMEERTVKPTDTGNLKVISTGDASQYEVTLGV